MHLYVLVAAPFVAELLRSASQKDPAVGFYSSWIQAAFLIGWALGGGFFGRIADRLGRSRALMLTILTYATFTGLSYFAQTWWQLLIFRFLAALGIGGEWAIGASLLSETWPRRWRPWMAAVLQTGVNIGVMLAASPSSSLADLPPRSVFLVGVLPALLVLWIRRAVPEPEEWAGAKQHAAENPPVFLDLFRGSVHRITFLTLLVCGFALYCALGLPVLVPAAPAKSAGTRGVVQCGSGPARQHGHVGGRGHFHRGELPGCGAGSLVALSVGHRDPVHRVLRINVRDL